jgi:Tol biopolymer transport system component
MSARRPSPFSVVEVLALLGSLAAPASGQGYTLQQIDVSSGGVQGNSDVWEVYVSGDGRYVAYTSTANNLVPGDTNGTFDAFVRDLLAGTTERVSVGVSGQQANGESAARAISFDGRYVVFGSVGTNVHPSDTDPLADIFVRDRWLGTTELISLPFDASPSQYDCKRADISGDGRYVVFDGGDSNLAPGDTNGTGDVFLRDRLLGTTEIVSLASDGTQGDLPSWIAAISGDGMRIAFLSKAKTFYPNNDDYWHAFLRDRTTGTTLAVDLSPWGRLGNQHMFPDVAISPDGSTVVFNSQATNLLPGDELLVHFKPYRWREGEPMQAITFAGGRTGLVAKDASLTTGGRFVAFEGGGQSWVTGDPTSSSDIFLQDTELHVTQQASSNGYANPANFSTTRCSMSWDGRVIAFTSYADNLVPGTTGLRHGFVRISDLAPGLAGMAYCWPGKSPAGCQSALTAGGLSSASAGAGHDLRLDGTLNDQIGLFLYSTTGTQGVLAGGGWSCIAPPWRRMPLHPTGGSPPPTLDCSGSFSEDFNAWIAAGQDPALVAGAPVWLQGWTRDPTAPGGALLSDALAFFVGP